MFLARRAILLLVIIFYILIVINILISNINILDGIFLGIIALGCLKYRSLKDTN